MNEQSIIHAFWMPGSMDTPGLQTGRADFVIHPEKGWLSVWADAWASDSSDNAASVANTWVSGPYTKGKTLTATKNLLPVIT